MKYPGFEIKKTENGFAAITNGEPQGWERNVSELMRDGVLLGKPQVKADRAAYTVLNLWKTVPELRKAKQESGINCDLTLLNYGVFSNSPDGEIFCTYGHAHEKERGEIYLLLDGSAVLILSDMKSVEYAVEMEKGDEFLISSEYAHRLYAKKGGAAILGFVPDDAGHDYNAIRGKGFPYHLFMEKGKYKYKTNPNFKGVEIAKLKPMKLNALDMLLKCSTKMRELLWQKGHLS